MQMLDLTVDADVIIIFNSGGWGNTSPKEAKDLAPIIDGVQEVLRKKGYTSVIFPHIRTENTLRGKIFGLRYNKYCLCKK